MDKYILVTWPGIQYFMESDRFHECLFVDNLDGHDEVPDSGKNGKTDPLKTVESDPLKTVQTDHSKTV